MKHLNSETRLFINYKTSHYNRNHKRLLVLAGTDYLHYYDGIRRRLSKVVPHENYGNYRNDIALIKLEKPLQFSDSLKPIEIASEEVPVDSSVTICGWGQTSRWGFISNKLMFNTLMALSEIDCAKQSGISFKGLMCLGHSLGNEICRVRK